jgi:hypothetical protein
MRKPILAVFLFLGAALYLTGSLARAQPPYRPGPDPRAYRHFLLSRSPYKVYSTATPGAVIVTQTPFTRHTMASGAGYLNQRISPRGFEEYRVVPGYEERFEAPYYGSYLYVPPQVRHYYLPPRQPGPPYRP